MLVHIPVVDILESAGRLAVLVDSLELGGWERNLEGNSAEVLDSGFDMGLVHRAYVVEPVLDSQEEEHSVLL